MHLEALIEMHIAASCTAYDDIVNPYHAINCMNYTPPHYYYQIIKFAGFEILACILSSVEKSADLDQLASQKPADLDLHYFQNRMYHSLVWQSLIRCVPELISNIKDKETVFINHLSLELLECKESYNQKPRGWP